MTQPDACLQAVPQVPEQERGCQPDDAEAADGRDQQSVDERERRGQEPVDRRRGEGKAPPGEERQYEDGDRRDGEPQGRGGAPGESCPTTSSSMPAIARDATSSSNQYRRAMSPTRLTR